MLIEANNLNYYVGNKPILKGISLSLYPQQIVTLLGPNGAGKSTLIKILLGLLNPSSGRVERQAGLKIGYVPQAFNRQTWMPITVLDLLKLYIPQLDTNHTLFEQLNLNPLLKAQMLDLSGGELQRVLIAQAILQKPQLLVLDEPLQGVDFMGQNIFYDLIQSLKETYQLSILLVSHDIHLIMAKTDQVLCLNQHICCMGSPDKIQNNPEFLNLFGLKDTANLGFYTHHHNHHHDW